jgi:hypothetical protein
MPATVPRHDLAAQREALSRASAVWVSRGQSALNSKPRGQRQPQVVALPIVLLQ